MVLCCAHLCICFERGSQGGNRLCINPMCGTCVQPETTTCGRAEVVVMWISYGAWYHAELGQIEGVAAKGTPILADTPC